MNEDVKTVLVRTGACGVLGAFFGGVLSSFRPQASIPFYVVGVGSNFAIVGGTYFAINQGILVSNVLRDVENEREGYYRHALSGAITGAFWLAVYGGRRRGLYGGVSCAAAGVAGFYIYSRFEKWRLAERERLRMERKEKSELEK